MKSKLSLDEMVETKWKQLNNLLYWGFIFILVVRIFVRLNVSYNIENNKILDGLMILSLVFLLSWAVINISYFIKPNWFYKKVVD